MSVNHTNVTPLWSLVFHVPGFAESLQQRSKMQIGMHSL